MTTSQSALPPGSVIYACDMPSTELGGRKTQYVAAAAKDYHKTPLHHISMTTSQSALPPQSVIYACDMPSTELGCRKTQYVAAAAKDCHMTPCITSANHSALPPHPVIYACGTCWAVIRPSMLLPLLRTMIITPCALHVRDINCIHDAHTDTHLKSQSHHETWDITGAAKDYHMAPCIAYI